MLLLLLVLFACSNSSSETNQRFPYGVYTSNPGTDQITLEENGNFTYKVSSSVLTSGTFSVQGSEITWETDSYCDQSGARKATYKWTFNNDILIFNILVQGTCPDRLAVLNLIQYHVEK
jgi:hypothetical protein